MFEKLCCLRLLFSKIVVTAGLLLSSDLAQGAVDTFEDGNDDGWVRYNPLASQGSGASYSFPPVQTPFGLDHRFRIEASPSSNPDANGSARAGAFRFDISPAANSVSWVVTAWDASKNQSFGGFAGVYFEQDNTFDGFGFTYSTVGSLDILRMDNGVPSVLASSPIILDSTSVYRFVFTTSAGGGLTGSLYNATDLSTALVRFGVVVPAFVNGASGLYLFANDANSGIGATFDNFGVSVIPEPSAISILGLSGLVGLWFARRRLNSR